MAKGTAGSQKLPQDLLSHPMWSALRKRHVLRITFLITLGTICAFVWGGGLLHHFSQSQGGVLSCAGLLRQALGQAGLPPSLGGESFPGFPGIRGFNQTEGMRPMKELGESIIPALFATERYAEKRAQYPGHQVGVSQTWVPVETSVRRRCPLLWAAPCDFFPGSNAVFWYHLLKLLLGQRIVTSCQIVSWSAYSHMFSDCFLVSVWSHLVRLFLGQRLVSSFHIVSWSAELTRSRS